MAVPADNLTKACTRSEAPAMARRNANQELNAWLDHHGYDHAQAKKRGRSQASATIRKDGPRSFKLIERHLPTDVGGRIDVTIIEKITPQDGGVVVDRHVKGIQEGRHVDDRSRKFYPDVSMEKAVSYRQRMGYSEVTRGGQAHAVRKADAIAAIRATGASAKYQDGEWRVNVPGGSEATAYYTNDADDAINTARRMMEHRAHARIVRQEPTGRPVFAEHERDGHITTSGRRALKRNQFALPPSSDEKRRGIKGRLPIDTIERARNALTRASQMQKRGDITARQLTAIRHKVNRAFPAIYVSPIED